MIPYGVVCYVPPSGKLNSEAFLRNVSAWQVNCPIYLYSDQLRDSVTNQIPNPEVVKNPRRWWNVNNCCFYFGLKLAIDAKLEYFLYLESDCRVRGDGWADKMFADAIEQMPNPVIYGSPIIYEIASSGYVPLRRATEFCCKHLSETGLAVPVYGGFPFRHNQIYTYPNGALGIYHTPTMAEIFHGFDRDIGHCAMNTTAWDIEVGIRLWNKFGLEIFDRFAISHVSYSGCTDQLVTEAERKEMLMRGERVAVHQVKANEDWL